MGGLEDKDEDEIDEGGELGRVEVAAAFLTTIAERFRLLSDMSLAFVRGPWEGDCRRKLSVDEDELSLVAVPSFYL